MNDAERFVLRTLLRGAASVDDLAHGDLSVSQISEDEIVAVLEHYRGQRLVEESFGTWSLTQGGDHVARNI
jgi:hypothetical protein